MYRCILCGKTYEESEKDSKLTEEHIIPRALGNTTLKADFLCKDCNSKLGDKIDCKLINAPNMLLYRKLNNISSRNDVPNVFAKGQDDDGNRYIVSNDMKPKIVPSIKTDGNKVQLHAPDKKTAKEMLEKTLSRKGINREKIDELLKKIDGIEPKKINPELKYEFEIDINYIFLAILKIAYEYAYLKLGDAYFNDNRADEIRKILTAGINGSISGEFYKKMGVNLAPENVSECLNSSGLSGNNHLLNLFKTEENCLMCLISLFSEPNETYVVLISDNADLYEHNEFEDIIEVKKN